MRIDTHCLRRTLVALAFVTILIPQSGSAQSQNVFDELYALPDGITQLDWGLVIKGSIQSGDAQIFEAYLKQVEFRHVFLVENKGGSVLDAIDIGRMVRAVDGTTQIVGYCHSSCSLVFVGGALRIGGPVGVHRPYFAASFGTNSPTSDNVEKMYEGVSNYLDDMNISPRLYEIMMATPPEQMTVLDPETQVQIIPMDDPIYEEWNTSAIARSYGLGSVEYRQLRNIGYFAECQERGEPVSCAVDLMLANLWKFPVERKSQVQGLVERYRAECGEAIDAEALAGAYKAAMIESIELRSPVPQREFRNGPETTWLQDCLISKMRNARDD